MQEFLQKLNQEQLAAVTHAGGPFLIIAGAGTGKTTVLIDRLLYLFEQGLKTDEILLLTFTEKAAGEMVERADKVLPLGYLDLWISTFHSFCERVLREHALDIGLPGDFRLLTQTEQWVLIKKNIKRLKLDYYQPLGNPNKFIYELIKHFSRLKDENISSQDYLDYVESLDKSDAKLDGLKEDDLELRRLKELANAYHFYNQLLLENNFLDFGDLICYTLKLFKTRPNILQKYQKQFKQVLVDEFQDTNFAQYELVKMLSLPDNNLMVVGDDFQSIYRFRGTSMANIMQFKDDFPKAKEIVLTKNYRSGQKILDYAYHFIQNNNPNTLEVKLGIKKQLSSSKDYPGVVEHAHYGTESEELAAVASKIKEIYQSNRGALWSDFAILVRANDTADKFVQELERNNIPNEFVSLKGLYYKPIILDCLAYLKLLDNYHESSALLRVLNMEQFSLSPLDIVSINKQSRAKVWSTFETLRNINTVKNIESKTATKINKLLASIDKHSLLAKCEPVSKLFVQVINDLEIIKSLDLDRDFKIFSYLNQFYRKIKDLEKANLNFRLSDFIEAIDLELEAGATGHLSPTADDPDLVKVMTVHAAKGLEFKYVFLVGLVDKRFPTINRGEKISIPDGLLKEKLEFTKEAHLEEERRLFYVALTRAKDELYLTSASDYGGSLAKKPSKFIEEMDLATIHYQSKKNESELSAALHLLNKKEEPKLNKTVLPDRFSFSQIEAFSKCPRQYQYNFILRVPVLTKNQFIFGHLIHTCLYDFLSPLLDNQGQVDLFGQGKKKIDLSAKRIRSIFADHWRDDGWETKESREEYKKKGQDILSKFQSKVEEKNPPVVKFLERNFSYNIAGYAFRGVIDRIDQLPDGTVEIIDYKTGGAKEKLTADQKKQLILYQIVVEELFGLEVSALSYYYLEAGEKVSFIAKAKDKEKLLLDIKTIIEQIKKLDFTPTPSEINCQYCDFNNICEFRKV
jgi:DNA helicase-2/ATP-dependent DNA helicase PcrA